MLFGASFKLGVLQFCELFCLHTSSIDKGAMFSEQHIKCIYFWIKSICTRFFKYIIASSTTLHHSRNE